MASYTYLIINGLIILFPLIFSFESKLHFFKQWRRYIKTIIPVSLFFILWDMLATERGHWSFNQLYTTGRYVLNLPIEEIIFFITVPYSCLFLFELIGWIKKHTKKEYNSISINFSPNGLVQSMSSMLIACVLLLSYIFLINGIEYTAVVLLVTIVTSSILGKTGYFLRRDFWCWTGVCLVLFMITNSVLTGLPVVQYGSNFISNIRVGTIPIEDFLYNWSLLGLYLWRWNATGKSSN